MIKAQRTLTYTTTSSITRRKVRVRTTIVATYRGGAYVDLRFLDSDDLRLSSVNPSEVITVWDYRTGRSELDETCQADLARVLSAWIAENDTTEVDDLQSPIVFTGRRWLRAYVENR